MKSKLSHLLAFLLCVFILFNTVFSFSAYAKDLTDDLEGDNTDNWKLDWDIVETTEPDDKNMLELVLENPSSYAGFLLGNVGAFFNGDYKQISINEQYWKDAVNNKKVYVIQHKETGEKAIRVEKSVTNDMLNKLKEANKEPDNGGYELLKTVPASKISKLYYSSDYSSAAIQSMYNLLADNNGIIGVGYLYGRPLFYQIPQNVFYVKRSGKYTYAGTMLEYTSAVLYEDLVGGYTYLTARDPRNYVIKDWNDSLLVSGSNSYSKCSFELYDLFSQFVDLKSGLNPMAVGSFAYIVTNSGVSIPVFNTIDDAVAYSVSNNLYYTSSDYTGEGKDIIITFDQIEQINNGYYDDMYILLQQLIEQKGGNSLTPEQLQQIVDEVRASFGLIKDEINKGFQQQDILIQKNSSILQNIADALNSFFAETKRFRESMDKMMRDFINGQKYTPPNTEPSTEPSTEPGTVPGTGTGDDIVDTGGGGLLKKLYDTVKDGFSDAVKELKKIKRWSALDTIIDGAGLVTDIVSLITDLLDPAKAADAVAEFVAEGADALTGVKDLMTDRFPFCIPADILILMQVLAHEPEAPHFEVPIVLERWGIDEKLVIDFSDFEYVSKICRTFLTIAWCFSLMNMTTKITNMKSI